MPAKRTRGGGRKRPVAAVEVSVPIAHASSVQGGSFENPSGSSVNVSGMHPKLANFGKIVTDKKELSNLPLEDSCLICFEPFYEPSSYDEGGDPTSVILLNCGHHLHHNCAFKLVGDDKFLRCPNCNVVMGIRTGNQPVGAKMQIHVDHRIHIHGFNCPTIMISYSFMGPQGIQDSSHPNPGKLFSVHSFPRVAYLPLNEAGKKICEMLKVAFERRLIFTVGTSATNGMTDTVTWASIHHKTSPNPGPFGYPDPNYFENVTKELEACGVTPKDVENGAGINWDNLSNVMFYA